MEREFKIASRIIGGLVALIGLLAMTGWVLEIPLLRAGFRGLTSMVMPTAVCFVVIGTALACCGLEPQERWRRVWLNSAALLVFLYGALGMTELFFARDLGSDSLALAWPSEGHHMSPLASSSFILVGLGMLLAPRRVRYFPNALFSAVGGIGLLAVLGYSYGVDAFYQVHHYRGMALTTATGLCLTALAALLAVPNRGLMRIFCARTPASAVARFLFPTAVVLPFLFGWLHVQGENAGVYNAPFGAALLVIAIIAVFGGLNLLFARRLFVSEMQRAQGEQRLRESEERLQATFDKAGVGIVEVAHDDHFIAVNDRICEILGYSREELLALNVHHLTAPEDRSLSDQLNAEIHSGKRDRVGYDKRYLRRDGTPLWVHVTVSSVRDSQGKWLRSITTIEDISERKRAEEALSQHAQMLARQADMLDLANVIVWNWNGEVTLWNRGAELLYGWRKSEALGKNLQALLQTALPESLDQIRQTLLRAGRWEGELQHVRKDGCRITVASVWVLHRDETGEPHSIIEVNNDITGRVEAEKQLKRIEWLLKRAEPDASERVAQATEQPYGRLVPLDNPGMICRTVGERVLRDIASDYMDLLGTSTAIYEKNGDYALGLFSSSWCQFMDTRSRGLCGACSNKDALVSGKWLCHESCWTHASRQCIEQQRPVDIECNGGIRLYAVPIMAGKEVLGSINFGYGDPPRDRRKLVELAARYGVTVEELEERSRAYESRPQFIVDVAKRRLVTSARLIGEIVERRRKEEELKDSERQFRAFFENTAVGAAQFDLRGRFLQVNDRYCHITGYSQREMLTMRLADLSPAENRNQDDMRIERFVTGATDVYDAEKRYVRKDGRVIWVHATAGLIRGPDGKPERIAGIVEEITDRKQAEEALLRAKQEWERTFDSVPDLISIIDKNHRVMRVNKAMAERLKSRPEHCVGLTCYQCVHGTDSPPPSCPHVKTMLDLQPHTEEFYEKSLGGSFLITTSPLFDEKGNMTGSVHVARDITERKKYEQELRDREEDLNRAQAVAQVGSWRLDVRRNELLWSDENYRIFGIPKGTPLTYETFLNAVHPEDREFVDYHWKAALRGELYDVEHRIVVGDQIKWIREKAELEFGSEGELVGGFGTSQDVTQRKEAQEALNRAKEALAQANLELEAKVAERTAELNESIAELEHFSYTITHDMRAPLRAMQGFGELLVTEANAALSPEQKSYLSRIIVAAERMDNLITDALNYSKIVREEFELVPVDAAALLHEIIESYPHFQPPRAQIQIEGAVPLLMGNKAGLTQCFANLLNNAIKFRKPDLTPSIRIWAEDRDQFVRLCFKDNGIGIAVEHHGKIFQMFQRLSTRYEGTGIGLALVRKAAERMGGRVGLESELGEGSLFWLEFEKAPTQRVPKKPDKTFASC